VPASSTAIIDRIAVGVVNTFVTRWREALAVLDLVAVDKLFVPQQVAVCVHDPLRKPRRARRVVELCGIVRHRVSHHALGGVLGEKVGGEHDKGHAARLEARRVRLVRDEHGGLGIAEPMRDPVVAVQDRH
jgi:hypothetical protein